LELEACNQLLSLAKSNLVCTQAAFGQLLERVQELADKKRFDIMVQVGKLGSDMHRLVLRHVFWITLESAKGFYKSRIEQALGELE